MDGAFDHVLIVAADGVGDDHVGAKRHANKQVEHKTGKRNIGADRRHGEGSRSPEKLPMMTVAIRFDSCSKMLVAATGKANRGILRHSEPVVMSMCLDTVSAIRSQSLTCFFVLICADDDTPNRLVMGDVLKRLVIQERLQ